MTRACGHAVRALVVMAAMGPLAACASLGRTPERVAAAAARQDALERAQVWQRTDVSHMDLRRGPGGKGHFAPNATVECRYDQRPMSGGTPKVTCVRDGDELKVKYGDDNGEVYAEVAATRLLWALGFGADRMYPVRVRCHECPIDPGGPPRPGTTIVLDVAAIERKFPGKELEGPQGTGWAWPELNAVKPERGGAPRAQRDALALLAAMLQHTDSKPEQQRLVCRDGTRRTGGCRTPFLLVSDLGKTFGHASLFNRDAPSSVNLQTWTAAPVWLEATGCRARLGKSLTGTLENPVISEEGRRFLAGLLQQLTDGQLRDLFTVARFPDRRGAPTGSVDAWVDAFKAKRRDIVTRSCAAAGTPS